MSQEEICGGGTLHRLKIKNIGLRRSLASQVNRSPV